ncbi:hypothetical protein RE879_004576 [Salmonella enterica]|nr:hypothetical protein [Salmonella enterica]EKZ8200036.1 hypothetical protein [Salmonella enterica]
MGNKKKTGAKVSGDPRKRAATKGVECTKKRPGQFDNFLDEFLSPKVIDKSDELAETFLNSISDPFRPDEIAAIKRFFLALALSAHVRQLTATNSTVNFEKMAVHARISKHLCNEIRVWMEEKGLITEV